VGAEERQPGARRRRHARGRAARGRATRSPPSRPQRPLAPRPRAAAAGPRRRRNLTPPQRTPSSLPPRSRRPRPRVPQPAPVLFHRRLQGPPAAGRHQARHHQGGRHQRRHHRMRARLWPRGPRQVPRRWQAGARPSSSIYLLPSARLRPALRRRLLDAAAGRRLGRVSGRRGPSAERARRRSPIPHATAVCDALPGAQQLRRHAGLGGGEGRAGAAAARRRGHRERRRRAAPLCCPGSAGRRAECRGGSAAGLGAPWGGGPAARPLGAGPPAPLPGPSPTHPCPLPQRRSTAPRTSFMRPPTAAASPWASTPTPFITAATWPRRSAQASTVSAQAAAAAAGAPRWEGRLGRAPDGTRGTAAPVWAAGAACSAGTPEARPRSPLASPRRVLQCPAGRRPP
jgi:hypothetical protein